ncbi:helix-turn-helix domain-containing protein [Paenibacillus sp. NPDC056579]|uniref:helix-turn-helix domain-containing protein n=1 Tax=Paenibacillus sp. NPDC056579 TaxID=3345871 RepID=UPI0036D1FAD2
MSEIGLYIRSIRQQRGADVAEFARELGVSPDYLRNLESGRTQTIQLEVINKLQNEFFTIESDNGLELEYEPQDAVGTRIDRLAASLKALHETDPAAADYLIRTAEQGLEWISASHRSSLDAGGHIVVRSL